MTRRRVRSGRVQSSTADRARRQRSFCGRCAAVAPPLIAHCQTPTSRLSSAMSSSWPGAVTTVAWAALGLEAKLATDSRAEIPAIGE